MRPCTPGPNAAEPKLISPTKASKEISITTVKEERRFQRRKMMAHSHYLLHIPSLSSLSASLTIQTPSLPVSRSQPKTLSYRVPSHATFNSFKPLHFALSGALSLGLLFGGNFRYPSFPFSQCCNQKLKLRICRNWGGPGCKSWREQAGVASQGV